MNKNIIVHISEVDISTESGMGRVEYYWKQAFEQAGYTFIHIGPKEIGNLRHNSLFPINAYKYFKKLNVTPKAFIVHEPASGYFVNRSIPCFVESHGIERRYWEAQLNGSIPNSSNQQISLITKYLFPIWRLHGCDKGLKRAYKLLLINSEDKEFVKVRYKRKDDDILIFKNGVNAYIPLPDTSGDKFTILFNGSWLQRKGIRILIEAAQSLYEDGLNINYLLIGTGIDVDSVLQDWPAQLRAFVKVVPSFSADEENKFLASSSLFILPSYFEGQPLSLLQAMAAGKCCISTNCCGQTDIIQNGKTGLLFSTGNVRELSILIKNCYNDRNIMEIIGNNAKQYTKHLSWSKVSKEVASYVLSNLYD